YRLSDRFLSRGLTLAFTARVQFAGGDDRPRPGPKVLSREILAGDFTDVLVHIRGTDMAYFASLVEILKEIVTGQFLAFFDDPCQAAVGEFHGVVHPALAAEVEHQLRAFDAHVAVAQSG